MIRYEVHKVENPKAILYWIGDENKVPEIDDMVFVVIYVEDWERDLSPWYADGLRKNESFLGEGEKTIEEIGKVLEEVEKDYPTLPRYVIGYSMAGLFALWMSQKTGWFSKVGSCSGSYWYPGIVEYLESHPFENDIDLYFSLGDKEEISRHPVLKTVGDNTRKIVELMKKDEHVKKVDLVMHEGGHFNDPEGRMLQAVTWMKE